MTQAACTIVPEGQPPNVLQLGPTCGRATFPVDTAMRRQGTFSVAAAGSVYVRTIKLSYGSAGGGTAQQSEIALHRLLADGETSDAFPTTRGGLELKSVTVDVSPPGYDGGRVMLGLFGDGLGAAAEPTTLATPALGGGAWVEIGTAFAHLAERTDTIEIGRDKGRFDGLVISARGNDLPVQSVTVVPVEGPPFSANVRTVIAPGMSSQVIALDPPDFVRSITITYGTTAPQSRAPTVEVRGRFAENWIGKIGENRQYAGGWILLGTVDVLVVPHRRAAREGFRVGGQDGSFKKVRLVARRSMIDIVGVTVNASDGREETLPVNSVLMPNVPSAPISFSAGALPIGSVSLSPRLHAGSRIDASVEVWAQY